MKKALLLTPLAVLALASCTDNEFLGSEEAQHTINGDKAISFESGAKALTRADITGPSAAALLDNNYIVYGVKGDGSVAGQKLVFDHYNINWYENSKGSTETNVADWEYVGQTPNSLSSLPSSETFKQQIKYWDYSTSQYDFVAFSYGKAQHTSSTAEENVVLSNINTANLGKSTDVADGNVYSVTGPNAELAKTYIADLLTVKKTDYAKTVTPRFRQMGTKVRMAIYETVPGYSVRVDRFYTSKTRKAAYATQTATLFATDGTGKQQAILPSPTGKGTMKVYVPNITSGTDLNVARTVYEANAGSKKTSLLYFKTLQDDSKVLKEWNENEPTTVKYLGRSSAEATYATPNKEYKMVLPYNGSTDLRLHVDYTLVSIDGSGEEIHVKGATAIIPAVYTNWQSNYAYTYIFKISKATNGTTGDPGDPGTPDEDDPKPLDPPSDPDNPGPTDPDDPDYPQPDPTPDPDPTPGPDPIPGPDPSGLYPIVFDAVIMDYADGIQETITTVSDPSITTYAKGVEPTVTSEYSTGKNIYICLENPGAATLTATNSKLYTVTVDDGALQKIDEGSVANAIKNGQPYKIKSLTTGDSVDGYYTYDSSTKTYVACGSTDVAIADTKYYEKDNTILVVYDAAGKAMTVTKTNILSIETEIAASDATDGNAVTGNFAMFSASAAGTYVFEYTATDNKKHYKIIIVHN